MTSESLRSQDEEFVVLEIRSPDIDDQEDKTTEASELLARELRDGKLHLPKSHGTVKIRARRNRLVEHSTYFRSLFGGNFKESASEYVIVDWNLATFIAILQFIDGGPIDVSIVNFVPLLEGAFFFGVDNVVMECKNWFVRTLTSRRIRFCKGFLQQLIDIWNFGVDNGIRFILEHCVNCVALNFVEIVHCESFASLPYALLKDCISHPLLTVNSEQQLCEALLFWFANNGQFSGVGSSICGENTLKVLEKVRFGLLPLEFILGPLWREYPSLFTSSQMMTMLEKISYPRLNGHSDVLVGDFECFRLRLTQYSEVSIPALTYIISRNPNLKVLNARGCKRMSGCSDQLEINDPSSFHSPFGNTSHHGELAQELCKLASLQELAIGWGLSGLILETLKPALGSLKSLAVGLGGSLGQQAWLALPEICPSLECISVCFQVVSDEGIVNVLRNLRHIHTLELQHCLGDLTSQCLSVGAPNLKSLKLDGVARWMTDDDLTSLTQNCRNLCQLSLSGCKFLTSDAQCIIASGWPGLTKIHLEDCGKVTSNGVSNLLNCKAIQDLLLRHNGSGIPRNFISDAAMKLPLLRTLSLDLCDACETGFNTPNYLDRFSLNTVKLACCKFQRRAFELQGFSVRGSDNVQRHCVHKETIVLEWNSKEFRTTIVHERL